MDILSKLVSVGMIAMVGLTACAEPPTTEQGDSPEAATDALDALEEGTSYNGWTQSVYSEVWMDQAYSWSEHTFTRSYGDSTRGGGSCWVYYDHNTSCSADSQCQAAAVASYGSAAYGYCYSNKCYYRPGAAATHCAQNPNRSPGALYTGAYGSPYSPGFAHVLGCMTKAAGPSTACGGTDTSLYMRTVAQTNVLWVTY